jgi:ribosomal-protein-alanine N-acetyltransferase
MKPGELRVRRMAVKDLARVMEIADGLKEAPHWAIETYKTALDPGAAVRRVALVAEDPSQRRIVGFVVVTVIVPEAELETIAMAADAQGAGVGGRLLGAVAEELLKHRVAEVHLEVRSSNERALRLYRRSGFEETGRRTGYYSDPVEDAVLMSRRLESADGR